MNPRIQADVSLLIVICLASTFILPLSFLLLVQTQNFLSGKTTSERLKANQVANLGIPISEMKGKELAQDMLLDGKSKIFKKK